ncbi:hypothetical protein [Aeoliella sp.]|uniref:hypothetical protein n=1 Tax=Aeoliella sp. TaxID=2795800 RepID=UPI003CCBA4CF
MKTLRAVLLVLAAGLAADVAVGAQIAASNFTSGWVPSGFRTDIGLKTSVNVNYTNSWVSQPFVAEFSGTVTAVDLAIKPNSFSQPLLVGVREDNGGIPGSMLGEVSVPSSAVSLGYFPNSPGEPLRRTTVDFSSVEVAIEQDMVYHLTLRVDQPTNGGTGRFSSHVMRPHAQSFRMPYLVSPGDPTEWRRLDLHRLEFPVEVRAVVPEPSALPLALGGLVGAACWLRARRDPAR